MTNWVSEDRSLTSPSGLEFFKAIQTTTKPMLVLGDAQGQVIPMVEVLASSSPTLSHI